MRNLSKVANFFGWTVSTRSINGSLSFARGNWIERREAASAIAIRSPSAAMTAAATKNVFRAPIVSIPTVQSFEKITAPAAKAATVIPVKRPARFASAFAAICSATI